MPLHLGYEITEELADSDRSIIYDQARIGSTPRGDIADARMRRPLRAQRNTE